MHLSGLLLAVLGLAKAAQFTSRGYYPGLVTSLGMNCNGSDCQFVYGQRNAHLHITETGRLEVKAKNLKAYVWKNEDLIELKTGVKVALDCRILILPAEIKVSGSDWEALIGLLRDQHIPYAHADINKCLDYGSNELSCYCTAVHVPIGGMAVDKLDNEPPNQAAHNLYSAFARLIQINSNQ